ncbi:P-loop containing nucleoside triphosphate hydrolase protein [Dissophora ornata]|nr:P-loop containing nucleoside triphosphate hydrolase protein [Dissophora ornata]
MAASRPAVTLRLSASLREKVLRSGYGTVEELRAAPIGDLASELKLSTDQIRELQHQLHPSYQTLEHEKKWSPITTSSTAIDALFRGGQGIPPGKITEICGLSGSGKTQLGLQLCINAQIPCPNGAGGTSIYVDTEGSFVARRVAQMAMSCSDKLSGVEDSTGSGTTMDAESIMQGIQYCRVHSPVELIAMIRALDGIVQAHPKTKLIVVDSISFLFRSNFSDMNLRTKLVANVGRQLAALAREYDVAVLVINQMTTKIESLNSRAQRSSEHLSGKVQPALGETWANICTHRIRLYSHMDGRRSARLFKSPTTQEQTVSFQIVGGGISDVDDTSLHVPGSPADGDMGFGFDPAEALFWEGISWKLGQVT